MKAFNPEKNTALQAWLSIVAIILLFIVAMIDRNGINLMIDPIKESLSISDVQISLLQGPAFAIFFLAGSIMSGWLVNKYSNRWIIFLSVLLWSSATILSGFSDSFIMLLIARCIVGLGESVLQPAGWNIVGRLFPKEKLATALSMLTAGTQVGVAASFLLTGHLISEAGNNPIFQKTLFGERQSWQWVFLIAGAAGILLSFVIFVVPKTRKDQKSATEQKQESFMSFVVSNRLFLLCHFAGFGLISIMVNGAGAWVPSYLIRVHEINVKNVGLLLGVGAVSLGVVGVILAGMMVDKAFRKGQSDAHLKHFAIRALLISIIGFAGFYYLGSSLTPMLLCLGFIQFIQPFSGVAGASLQITTPEHFRTKITAIFIMFYNAVGMVAGPSFVALISDYFGDDELGTALGVNYLLLGGAAFIFLTLGRRYAQIAYAKQLALEEQTVNSAIV